MFYNPRMSKMPQTNNRIRRQSCREGHIPTNILKMDDGYDIQLAVPGLQKEDIKLYVEEGILVITGEHDTRNTDKVYNLKQFDYGNFTKRFELSDDIDQENIEAEYNQGILSIRLHVVKNETADIVRRVEIK